MAEWSMADGIRFIGRDSGLFELIFRPGKAGVQELQLYLDDDGTAPIPTPNGSTLVPLRRTADAFGVTIKYDPQTRRLLLHDDITGTDIALTVGSRLVEVNGETV
ncbi:MAG: copper amine oxidase N-terminal domain-containing protein [Thermobacillus sp.]|nr:MAG: copper amine oxidase N-terminal domain-containing protein [Thermobacillus sp.]